MIDFLNSKLLTTFSHFSDERILVQKMYDEYICYKELTGEEDDEWLLQSVTENETV